MKLRVLLARWKRKLFKKKPLNNKQLPMYWFDQLLGNQPATIVQIGSNDGKTGDPLYELLHKNQEWKALFVEPIPHYFEQLKTNYPDKQRFSFENTAINQGDELQFFWVDQKAKLTFENLPFWYEQIGSFNKAHILNELGVEIEPFIVSKTIQGINLKTLFAKHQMENLDILHIDTEGYDWIILSQLDLANFQPKFILFEYNHLSDRALREAYDYLNDLYILFQLNIDLLAIHKSHGKTIIQQIEKSQSMKRFHNSSTSSRNDNHST